MKVIGVVRKVFPTETVGAKDFKKRTLWIEEVEVQYPNFFAIEFTQANTVLLDRFKPNDLVEVEIEIKGRYYKKPADGKEMVFTSIGGWKIELLSEARAKEAPSTRQQNGGIPSTANPGSVDINSNGDDDLPF